MKGGSEVLDEDYGVYGKVIREEGLIMCGEVCIGVDLGGMVESGV